jgi:hypothetical protein
MAVELEFCSVIVRIEVLRRMQAHRFEDCIGHPLLRRKIMDAIERGTGVWDPCWYDGQLFRHGSMGGDEVSRLLDDWRVCGLRPTEELSGETRWKDLCVALSGQGIIDHRCDWAIYDASTNSVSLALAAQAPRVGPGISRGVEAFEAGDFAQARAYLEPLAQDPRRYGSEKARRYLDEMKAKGAGS